MALNGAIPAQLKPSIQSAAMIPRRTAAATASIRVRTPIFEQAFSKYPDTVADMLRVAQHRGWTRLKVDGDDAFRREVWIQGRAMGLDIKGYSPRDRDRQAAGQPASRRPLEERLRMASVVVRNLIPNPEAQRRLLNHAAAAIARITDRGSPERRSRTYDRQR